MSHLKIWTVYDHPKDYPDHFVARLYYIRHGKPVVSKVIITHEYLEHLRQLLPHGLTCLTRDIADDPCIIESWF
jgi:hypothetical protein